MNHNIHSWICSLAIFLAFSNPIGVGLSEIAGSRNFIADQSVSSLEREGKSYTNFPSDFIGERVVGNYPDGAINWLSLDENNIDLNKLSSASGLDGTNIDLWYGSHQTFGNIGIPQRWVNILGNVSNHEVSLSYSLNGNPESALSVGRDNPRLASRGDFNIELNIDHLNVGSNQVVITATDTLDNQTVETVAVEYMDGNNWPLPYHIDWSASETITEVAQIVDGLWTLETDSIRPVRTGYDRLIAIGGMTWRDYEVVVPITIHGVPSPHEGGVGVTLRWQGHFQEYNEQPNIGWWDMGAYGYYRFRNYGNHLALRLNGSEPFENHDVQLDFGITYIFKMRVESLDGQEGGFYSLKVWEDGQPEPPGWDLTAQDGANDLALGSVLLVAHKIDASFGNVAISPIDGATYQLAYTLVGNGDVTQLPDMESYNIGEVVTLTATPFPGWSFANWGGHISGNENPIAITIYGDTSVTATFTQDEYTLSVNTVGNGSVVIEPEQPMLHYGDVITLTAAPDPGWSFAEWNGDTTGNENPIEIIIQKDTFVTASFSQNKLFLPVMYGRVPTDNSLDQIMSLVLAKSGLIP